MYVCMYIIMLCISNVLMRNIENIHLDLLYVCMYVRIDVCM